MGAQEARPCVRPDEAAASFGLGRTLGRPPPRVRDYDKLNLDRLFADSRGIGNHRYEPGQYKAGNQFMREAIGVHQGLGDAARNVGKPLQCEALVWRHAILLV